MCRNPIPIAPKAKRSAWLRLSSGDDEDEAPRTISVIAGETVSSATIIERCFLTLCGLLSVVQRLVPEAPLSLQYANLSRHDPAFFSPDVAP
jgi:hypothetical protein